MNSKWGVNWFGVAEVFGQFNLQYATSRVLPACVTDSTWRMPSKRFFWFVNTK